MSEQQKYVVRFHGISRASRISPFIGNLDYIEKKLIRFSEDLQPFSSALVIHRHDMEPAC